MNGNDHLATGTSSVTTLTERRVPFVLGSRRSGGNAEQLLAYVAASFPAGVEQRWTRLRDLRLAAPDDVRHDSNRQSKLAERPVGDEGVLFESSCWATHIVIASPMHWYSVSALTKIYLDHWSRWMRVDGFLAPMRGTFLAGISALSELERTHADPLVGMLRNTAHYLDMEWGGGLLGYGNKPGAVMADERALGAATDFLVANSLS